MARVRTVRGRTFVCSDCGKSFTRLRGLRDHRNAKLHIKPFACPECDHESTRKSDCDGHYRRMHAGRRDFVCVHINASDGSMCGMAYASGQELNRHEEKAHPLERTEQIRGTEGYQLELCEPGPSFNRAFLGNPPATLSVDVHENQYWVMVLQKFNALHLRIENDIESALVWDMGEDGAKISKDDWLEPKLHDIHRWLDGLAQLTGGVDPEVFYAALTNGLRRQRVISKAIIRKAILDAAEAASRAGAGNGLYQKVALDSLQESLQTAMFARRFLKPIRSQHTDSECESVTSSSKDA